MTYGFQGSHSPCLATRKVSVAFQGSNPGVEGLIPLCSPHIYDSQKRMLDQAGQFGVNHLSLNCLHQPHPEVYRLSYQSVWVTYAEPAGLSSAGR